MSVPARVPLVPVSSAVLSSYDAKGATGGPRGSLTALSSRAAGRMTPDAADALLALSVAVVGAGGDFRVTDCLRSVPEQMAARAKYDAWVRAGSPKPGTAGYNAATMKPAFVALPGRSGHNAGRSIDVHIDVLGFPGVPASQQLDKLWELAKPLGWQPIIKAPTEGASESWHFDFWGPWKPVVARVGYESAAIAATLDIGEDAAFPKDGLARRLQGGLHRAGYNVGPIDGMPGTKTKAGLTAAGFTDAAYIADQTVLAQAVLHVDRLVSSPTERWHP